MAYLYHMDEPKRGWEGPYFQDMRISQTYTNSWENSYYAQENYDMISNYSSIGQHIINLKMVLEDFVSESTSQAPPPSSSIKQDIRDLKKAMEDFVNEARDYNKSYKRRCMIT